MSAAASSDGWTTVTRTAPKQAWGAPRSEAPAAFGSSRPRPSQQINHGTALRTERTAASTRAAAMDFASVNSYPTLGAPAGRTSAPTHSVKPAMDFRAAAAAAAAREDATVSATAAADAYAQEYARRRQAAAEAERVRRARLAAIGTRCHDDGPEDYDGPDEEDYVPAGTGTTDDWVDTSGGYTEAVDDHVAARRRGDHGVW